MVRSRRISAETLTQSMTPGCAEVMHEVDLNGVPARFALTVVSGGRFLYYRFQLRRSIMS